MIISNVKIITWDITNQILEGHSVRIYQDLITDIDQDHLIKDKYPEDEILDGNGQFLMPGLICAHTHFYGTFSRGLYIPGEAPADFPQILEKLWWPLDQSLRQEDIRVSSQICMIDAIKHGTTTLFDHHASPEFITGSLDVIESAFLETGLRGVVCYEVTDRGGKEKAQEGIEENLRMIKKLDKSSGLIRATFGMHASLTLSDETLDLCSKKIPQNVGIHIHVAEHQVDEYNSLSKSGERVVKRLNKFNLLNSQSILVHGVHLDLQEINLIAKTNSWLTHQPRSNMNNAVGLGDVEAMISAGVNVCMGNDGFSNTMWEEWKTCYLAHKLWTRDPRKMNGNNLLKMAVYNNSDLATQFFNGARIGRIEIGAKADLILVDYDPVTNLNIDNLPWHIIFGFRDSMVTTTMVDGKILMKDRKVLSINEKQVAQYARELSKETWNRYWAQF